LPQVGSDTLPPDVETASARYAERFRGPVGHWFLSVQSGAITRLLNDHGPARSRRILEIGGGHAQLTEALLSSGHRVTVQASRLSALDRARALLPRSSGRLDLLVSELGNLPCRDRSFDVVVAIRLMAHVEPWEEFLAEMARVAGRFVVFDYTALTSWNVLSPLLFRLKRRMEPNTRSYRVHRTRRIEFRLRSLGFEPLGRERQFTVPMAIHRALGRVEVSRALEKFCRSTGLTPRLGSPVVLLAERRR